MERFYLLVLFASVLRVCAGAEWCYESQVTCAGSCKGPKEWAQIETKCGGTQQSPVNIVTKNAVIDKLGPFTFSGYQNAFNSILTNNGHTVKLNLSGSLIQDGGLGDNYKAIEAHFHWGRNGGPGSEHTIDGEQHPMEMHVVHIKERYPNSTEAAKDPTGIAVLGFLYEESASANNKYDSIIKGLAKITHPGNATSIGPLSLDMLIPSYDTLAKYYRYNGSLTTPGCSEAVVWTVFESTIMLSKAQLDAFSSVHFESGDPMVDTFRPVQPLNARTITYSGCTLTSVSSVLVMLSFLISFWCISG